MQVIRFASAMAAAKSVASILTSEKKRYSPYPYNRFRPDESLWWVATAKEWPAYKHGKYVFFEDGDLLHCGLHVEKGLGLLAAQFEPGLHKRHQILGNDWMWHRFMADLKGGKLGEALDESYRIGCESVRIRIDCIVVHGSGGYDPFAPKPDSTTFSVAPGSALEVISYKSTNATLERLRGAETLRSVPECLPDANTLEWVWIDAYVTMPFVKMGEYGTGGVEFLDGYGLGRLLEPLEQWIGTSDGSNTVMES